METVAASDKNAVVYMAVGAPFPYCRVRIADDDDRALPDGQVGHIHISGENVTKGYYENPEADAVAFTADGWLRTGDLGVVHEGELYITGRAKEIIFVNGQNYYPQDLENIAQRAEGLRLGKSLPQACVYPTRKRRSACRLCLAPQNTARFRLDRLQVSRLINESAGLEVAELCLSNAFQRPPAARSSAICSSRVTSKGNLLLPLAELRGAPRGGRGTKSALRTQIEEKIGTSCTRPSKERKLTSTMTF